MEKDTSDRDPHPSNTRSEDEESVDKIDDRSQTAKALDIVSKITAICLMMALPAIGGYYVDQWLGTKIVFILLGTAFGMFASGWQLFKLTQELNKN